MRQGSPTVVILSVSSDIGLFLAGQYLSLGYNVVGTYRSAKAVVSLRRHSHCRLFACDVHKKAQLTAFIKEVKALKIQWDAFISCVGHPLPLTAFFDTDFDLWQASVEVNCLDQLRALHMLYPHRRSKGTPDVVFFAAGGANNAVVNFSAYTIGKIMLTKMCEFLDAEEAGLNVFIVGPGWTRTKTHELILNDPGVSKAKSEETKKFLAGKAGTPLIDIFECIQWLRSQGRAVAGGRNFSIVYDPWRQDRRAKLSKQLRADKNMYKLRRHHNDFLQDKGR